MTTQAKEVKPTLALLRNVSACFTLVETLRGRNPHLPGLGVFHGPSGYGKTYAAIYAQNRTRGLRVEVGESWTRKSFLGAILAEAGLAKAPRTIADMMEAAIYTLGDDPDRPLFVDEADKAVDKGYIELIRELHDKAQVPIVLIGEEELPAKLQAVERTANRVLEWIPALPCDAEDTRALAQLFCDDIQVADDLLEVVRRQSDGRARRIVVNLQRIGEHARNHGIDAIDAAAFDGDFFTGRPARRRRAA
ncbi:AAA family ATPase [Afifella pfennigii]|uniref:AAA family ATPase n=1 Tax=Afifella pfennigii TaxID=209897 RepID=UPI00047D07D7|nr:ATP-binding protein [Afifella pfennigii]